MDPTMIDSEIIEELEKLILLLENNETVQRYKALEKRAKENKKLSELVERMREAQKDSVQYAHYEKPEAEKSALQQAEQLKKEFDEHPVVVAYRKQLMETNDLLQHLTTLIQKRMNEELEKDG